MSAWQISDDEIVSEAMLAADADYVKSTQIASDNVSFSLQG